MAGVGGWLEGQRHAWAINRRLLGFFPRAGAIGIAFLVVSAVSSLHGALRAVALGVVVSRVQSVVSEASSIRAIAGPLGLLGGILLFEQLTHAVREPLGRATARRVEGDLRRDVRAWLAARPDIVAIEDPHTQNDLAVATDGAAGVTMAGALVSVGATVSTTLGVVVAAFVVLPLSPLLVLGYLAILAVGRSRLRRGALHATAVRQAQAPFFRLRAYLHGLNRDAAKESRVYGLREFISDRHESAFREPFGAMLQAYWSRQRTQLLFLGIAVAFLAALGWVAVDQVLTGTISVGRATTYVLAAQAMLIAIGSTVSPSAQADMPLAALDRLREQVQPSTPAPERSPLPAIGNTPFLVLERVSFRYPGSEIDVLDGLDLVVHSGESLAIVGVNGAGKTSLIKLITGLYQPTGGRILVGGAELTPDRVAAWRREVAAVFQDFVQYPLPLRDNVTLGAGEMCDDVDLVEEALDAAGAADFTASLAAGSDTVLSKQFAGGTELSGGQWQRIALARVIYAARRGATLVLLDEPTANLDVRAEFEAFDRLLHATTGIARVIVSHRFSTVRKADRIVVVDGGRIVQDGTHEQLVARDGLYREMFLTQASRFGSSGAVEAGAAGDA